MSAFSTRSRRAVLFGNLLQVAEYDQIQFTKSPEGLRAMALELTKTAAALDEPPVKGVS